MKLIHVFTIFDTPKAFFDGQFRYLSDHGSNIVLISSDATDAYDFAQRNHIRFMPVQMPRTLSPIAIFHAIRQIAGIIRKENPDAVFGHTPVGALCAMMAARMCNVKNRIYYRHGLIYTTMKGIRRLVFKMEEQFVSALATEIISVSLSLSSLAVRDNLNTEKKQHVIGHGTCGGIDTINLFNPALLDENKLTERSKVLRLYNADIVFGFCGRICKDKGVPELVRAFELFRKKHSEMNSKLLLIGMFDIRYGVDEKCRVKIEEDTDIIVTGCIDKSDIPYYYALLNVFVFPSHREGFGMCVLEASAMQKPILVSRSHGCVDTIIEHETREYIELTSESICQGMEWMQNAELRKRLGRNGRGMVVEWYDYSVMWPLVKDLYLRALK